uniref:Uncharacterized protein n=1 Tax=viral metagenome TaxID=1070528 RepID=A0A6C0DF79_9ZZZZ
MSNNTLTPAQRYQKKYPLPYRNENGLKSFMEQKKAANNGKPNHERYFDPRSFEEIEKERKERQQRQPNAVVFESPALKEELQPFTPYAPAQASHPEVKPYVEPPFASYAPAHALELKPYVAPPFTSYVPSQASELKPFVAPQFTLPPYQGQNKRRILSDEEMQIKLNELMKRLPPAKLPIGKGGRRTRHKKRTLAKRKLRKTLRNKRR